MSMLCDNPFAYLPSAGGGNSTPDCIFLAWFWFLVTPASDSYIFFQKGEDFGCPGWIPDMEQRRAVSSAGWCLL